MSEKTPQHDSAKPPPTPAEIDLWTRVIAKLVGPVRPGSMRAEMKEAAEYATRVVEGVRAIAETEVSPEAWAYVRALREQAR